MTSISSPNRYGLYPKPKEQIHLGETAPQIGSVQAELRGSEVDYEIPIRDVVVLSIDIDATKISDDEYHSEVVATLRAYLTALDNDTAGRHQCEEYEGPRGTRLTITSSRLWSGARIPLPERQPLRPQPAAAE